MTPRRTHNDVAAIEDAIAVLLDMLIEHGLHREYQEKFLSGLPERERTRIKTLIEETGGYSRYMSERIRTCLAILEEARPGPYAYDRNRPAIRVEPRPLSRVVYKELV